MTFISLWCGQPRLPCARHSPSWRARAHRKRRARRNLPILRGENHPYTTEMIKDAEMMRVATFLSAGLVDMTSFIDRETRQVIVGSGDLDRGRAIFQTTCAACHGFDGRALDWGQGDEHNFIGTEATSLPDEVFNKLSNAHPGAAMINTRAFSVQDRINVLNYIATLPTGLDDMIVVGDDGEGDNDGSDDDTNWLIGILDETRCPRPLYLGGGSRSSGHRLTNRPLLGGVAWACGALNAGRDWLGPQLSSLPS